MVCSHISMWCIILCRSNRAWLFTIRKVYLTTPVIRLLATVIRTLEGDYWGYKEPWAALSLSLWFCPSDICNSGLGGINSIVEPASRVSLILPSTVRMLENVIVTPCKELGAKDPPAGGLGSYTRMEILVKYSLWIRYSVLHISVGVYYRLSREEGNIDYTIFCTKEKYALYQCLFHPSFFLFFLGYISSED